MNLPNLLTGSRLLAALAMPLTVILFDSGTAPWLAAALFAFASLTDFADGWLARRHGLETEIGRILDPVADKALTLIALLILCVLLESASLILMPAAVILLRDSLISTLRETGRHLPSSAAAKAKTAILMASILLLLLAAAAQGEAPASHAWARGLEWCGIAGLWMAAALAVVSGARYVSQARLAAKESE